jgi:hypothetical protein
MEEKSNAKQWSVQEIMGTLDEQQQMLLGYMMHIAMQKGRVMGRMEMDGKIAADIGEVLHVEADVIQKALDEDPFDVIAKN